MPCIATRVLQDPQDHSEYPTPNSTNHVLRQTGQNSLIKQLSAGHLHLLFPLMMRRENIFFVSLAEVGCRSWQIKRSPLARYRVDIIIIPGWQVMWINNVFVSTYSRQRGFMKLLLLWNLYLSNGDVLVLKKRWKLDMSNSSSSIKLAI